MDKELQMLTKEEEVKYSYYLEGYLRGLPNDAEIPVWFHQYPDHSRKLTYKYNTDRGRYVLYGVSKW